MIWIAHTAVNPDSPISDAGVLDEVEGVTNALDELGHPYTTITPEPSLLDFLQKITQSPREDIVFNLVESYRGSPWGEPWIASFYEAFGLIYTGSRPEVLSLCLDKRRTRAVLSQAGYPVAPGIAINDRRVHLDGFEFPAILKPACRDASEGLNASCVIRDPAALQNKIQEMIRDGYWPLLLEKFITGREFSISLLQCDRVWQVISIFEVDFSGLPPEMPHILCFDAKWLTETLAYIGTTTNPIQGDPEVVALLTDLAISVAQDLGLRDYVRVDMRYSHEGQPFIIDVNPNPDISLSGGFFRALATGGLTYTEFVRQVVENAQDRRHETKKLLEA